MARWVKAVSHKLELYVDNSRKLLATTSAVKSMANRSTDMV